MSENGDDNPYIRQLKDKVIIREFSPELVKSVPEFRRMYFLFTDNKSLPYRADGFRVWVLHEYGGCYFDLDVMCIRNMSNLFMGSEFVYSWEKQIYANNAIIFLRKGSFMAEYLVKKAGRRFSTFPWTLFNYGDKYMKYMKLYECSLFDPIWDKSSGMYIFEEFGDFMKSNPAIAGGRVSIPEEMFPYSYAHHWHNRWREEIESNSPFELCERYFDAKLGL